VGGLHIDACRIGDLGSPKNGRFPANVLFTHHPECEQVGVKDMPGRVINRWTDGAKPFGGGAGHKFEGEVFPDEKVPVYECHPDCPVGILERQKEGASRFFYCSKASRSERTCEGKVDNKHPTVKPLALMQYLVRLVTPVGGRVLDPFMGSGSTGMACLAEDMSFVGIEMESESFDVAVSRITTMLPDNSTMSDVDDSPQIELF
jgi:site-specific DNA-methyltransferase (adenine-specific)